MSNGQIKDTDQKALEINLNDHIYGTFAEIGAGQEVARQFFKVGAAAGTIAKTMSAYDKVYSDHIYGVEPSGRYVCESRLYKMLDHEYELMESRLSEHRPNTNFFVFADTVAAINYDKTINGDGWLGLRFQLRPDGPTNDMIIHVRMLDRDYNLQQTAIGILGVNMIYACYNLTNDMEAFVTSLIDGIRGRVIVDMIRITGPDFIIDNRVLSLYLVKNGLTSVAVINEEGNSIHASEFYKRSLMVVRGNYRPPTLVSEDVFAKSYRQFCDDVHCEVEDAIVLAELTLNSLVVDGDISDEDFLNRALLLNKLGHKIFISNHENHQSLISYLTDYKIKTLGLLIGVLELQKIIEDKYYQNMDGRLLSALGELFTKNIRIYVYPALTENQNEVLKASNIPVPEGIDFLFKYLLESQHIVEIDDYKEELLSIFPWEVLDMIKRGEEGWEKLVPEILIPLIKEKGMFGYPIEKVKMNYYDE